mgnify:CR=1 FL=1
MAKDWQVRKRRPVRKKNIAPLLKNLEEHLDLNLNVDNAFLEMAEYGSWQLVLLDRIPHFVQVKNPEGKDCAILTLRGLLAHSCNQMYAEVDRGAIPFLMNGADCMAAGIQVVDPIIERGDLVWVRDEEHGKPIAIGWALMDAETMDKSTKGKSIRTIHWIGDDLWSIDK